MAGKQDELQQILGGSMAINLISLMGENRVQQKQRQLERERKREELKEQGLPDEEIAKLEAEEDVQAEKAAQEASTGNALQDLEVCEFIVCCACVSVSFSLLFSVCRIQCNAYLFRWKRCCAIALTFSQHLHIFFFLFFFFSFFLFSFFFLSESLGHWKGSVDIRHPWCGRQVWEWATTPCGTGAHAPRRATSFTGEWFPVLCSGPGDGPS